MGIAQMPQPPRLTVFEAQDLQKQIARDFHWMTTSLTIDEVANHSTRTFEEYGIVGIWVDGDLVCSLARQGQFARLLKLASGIANTLDYIAAAEFHATHEHYEETKGGE